MTAVLIAANCPLIAFARLIFIPRLNFLFCSAVADADRSKLKIFLMISRVCYYLPLAMTWIAYLGIASKLRRSTMTVVQLAN